MKKYEYEIAGLKSLLNKIEFIKPCWVFNVEKNILKKIIKELVIGGIVDTKRTLKLKKKYRFHEIDEYCCWMCSHLDIISIGDMKCELFKWDTEPAYVCSEFKR